MPSEIESGISNVVALKSDRRLHLGTASLTLLGFLVAVFGGGGFAIWSGTAELESAALAPGVIVVESRRKAVAHLEGGIVESLLVHEGDPVERGQVLLVLADAKPRSQLEQMDAQYRTERAKYDRLIAERDSTDEIRFAPHLSSNAQIPTVGRVLAMQKSLFSKRRKVLEGQIGVIGTQKDQVRREIGGLTARRNAETKALGYLEKELGGVRELREKGYAREPHLLALQREKATSEGDIADLNAQIARAGRRIAELDLQEIQIRDEFAQSVTDELQLAERALQELEATMTAARDAVNRIKVRAPQSGIVVGLSVSTPGEIIAGGETIMEIVPEKDELIVEALVRPEDIDVVHAGQTARVRLSAYSYRSTPPVSGTIRYLSADRVKDAQTGTSAFHARVELDVTELGRLENVSLYPGMPAEVMILLGRRTFLDYLVSPLLQTFDKAFRES